MSDDGKVLGGTLKNNKIDYGFWGGKIDFNKGITDITITDPVKTAVTVGVTVVVAVIAAVVTIATGGLGALAIPGLLAGTTTLFAAGSITTGVIIGAGLTAAFAGMAAYNATQAFIEEGPGSVSAWLNVGAALLSIAFPVRIGGGVASGAAGLTDDVAKAVGGAAGASDDMARAAGVVTGSADDAARLAGAAAGSADDAARIITGASEAQKASRLATFGKNLLGSAGNTALGQEATGLLGTFRNARSLLFGGGIGWTKGASLGSNIARSLMEWGTSLSGMTQHMYSMAKLNVAMNAIATVLNEPISAVAEALENTPVLGDIFADIAVTGQNGIIGIFQINPGQSLMFGAGMFVGMPLAKGIIGGVKSLLPAGKTVVTEAGSAAANKFTSALNKAKTAMENFSKGLESNAAGQIAKGAYEEWFKEGAMKAGLKMFGISDAAAEYLVEFMSPDGAGINFTNTEYTQNINKIGTEEIQSADGSTRTSVSEKTISNALGYMNEMYAQNGLNVEVKATQSRDGNITNFVFTQDGHEIYSKTVATNSAEKSQKQQLQSIQDVMISAGSIAQVANKGNISELMQNNTDILAANVQLANGSVNAGNNMLAQVAVLQNNANLSQSNTDVLHDTFKGAYNTASEYNNFGNNSYWDSVAQQFIIGYSGSLNTATKASIINVVSKYDNAKTGKINTEVLVSALNSSDEKVSAAAYEDLQAITAFVNSGALKGISAANTPFTAQTVVEIITNTDVLSNNSVLSQIVDLGILNHVSGDNAQIRDAVIKKLNAFASSGVKVEYEKLQRGGYNAYFYTTNEKGESVNVGRLSNSSLESLYKSQASSAFILNQKGVSEETQALFAGIVNNGGEAIKERQEQAENRKTTSAKVTAALNGESLDGKSLSAQDQSNIINKMLSSKNDDITERRLAALMLFNKRDLTASGLMTNQAIQEMAQAVLNG
ncbi:MAG: hypothetical protein WCQ83_05475, partial [Endomicrobiia bacterium]